MDYLYRVLKIKTQVIEEQAPRGLPRYLTGLYRIQKASLGKITVFLMYPRTELEQVDSVRKHIRELQKLESIPAVLMLNRMTGRQRERFIDAGIPFIVDGKQIYLPFMGTCLQERCDGVIEAGEHLTPSAQMLLLYYIYQNKEVMNTSDAVSALGLTATSISRASRELEDAKLLRSRRCGIQKEISADLSGEELWNKAYPMLRSPVTRTLYIPREIGSQLLPGGYSALAQYSMLNPPALPCCAAYRDKKLSEQAADELVDSDAQMEIQFWKYDPKSLAAGNCVDPLSLALSLKDDPDERVEAEVEEMLETFWKEKYGKRD